MFHSFIPNKIITCIFKDPPCFNDEIPQFVTKKDKDFYNPHIHRRQFRLQQKLFFSGHTSNKFSKATRAIELIRKLHPILPSRSLLTIYKIIH